MANCAGSSPDGGGNEPKAKKPKHTDKPRHTGGPKHGETPGYIKSGQNSFKVSTLVRIAIEDFGVEAKLAAKLCMHKGMCTKPGRLAQQACPCPEAAGHHSLNDSFHKFPDKFCFLARDAYFRIHDRCKHQDFR